MTLVDLLYLACNRLAFTQEAFNTLLLKTDWEQIHSLFIIDDGSIDGTSEWLEATASRAPTYVQMIRMAFGSPISAMVHFIESANAPILAKIDNDAMVPPGWLRQRQDVLDRHPELDLLGSVFSRSKPQTDQKYYGLAEWQMVQGSDLVRGLDHTCVADALVGSDSAWSPLS